MHIKRTIYNDIKIIDKLSYKKRKITKKKDKLFYELDELQNLVDSLEESKVLQNIVEFLSNSGLRIGELLALNENDLDGDILHINNNKDQHGNITEKISLNKKCLDVWYDQIRINRNNKILKRNYKDTKAIFAKLDRYYNTYSNLRKSFEKIIGYAPKFHIFRHTHASLCMDAVIPLEYISERLGHDGTKITKEVYIHKTKNRKKKELDYFRNIVF